MSSYQTVSGASKNNIGRLSLTASAFNELGQYTSSPGRRGYCYAELAVFFPNGGRNHRQYCRSDMRILRSAGINGSLASSILYPRILMQYIVSRGSFIINDSKSTEIEEHTGLTGTCHVTRLPAAIE